MGIKIKEVEDAILGKLKTDLTDLKIEGYLGEQKGYRLNHPKGAVLTQYFGSDFSESLVNVQDVVFQEETQLFRMFISVKNLRDHQEVYEHIEAIKSSLNGFRPVASLKCKKMYPKQIRFVEEVDGVYTYGIIYAVELLGDKF